MTYQPFKFLHHTEINFRAGVIDEIGIITKSKGSRALIVCDAGVLKAGIIAKITTQLDRSGILYVIYDKVMANPRDYICEEVALLGKEFKVDVIIGVGGGSSMDTAKAANVLMTNGGTIEEWANKGFFDNNVFPLICVPTTAGTGSEVTYEAVITLSKTNTKVSVVDGVRLAPNIAIIDPELTLTVPPLVTASTGMDALTHAIEAYTCSYSNPISDALALYAIEIISENIVKATENGSDLNAREGMIIGSLMAGMAFTNSFLGAVHSLSERIGGFYDTPHGIANSIFLPFVTEYNLSSNYSKHARVAKALGIDVTQLTDKEASKMAVKKIFDMNETLGIPKFKEINGVNPDDFAIIAESCVTHICTVGNPKPIGKDEYLYILIKAYAL